MRAFHFRLQTKLDISEREEQLARDELRTRIAERDRIQMELDSVITRLHNIELSIRQIIEGYFSLEKLLLLKDYIPILRTLKENKTKDLLRSEQRIEDARNILIEKSKETKILNKLRDKEWQAYLQEMGREEQKNIDEVAINTHYKANLKL